MTDDRITPADTKRQIEQSDTRDGTRIGYTVSNHDKTHPIDVSKKNRVTHTLVTGATGTGKTVEMKHVALSDVFKGRGLAIIDPAGDVISQFIAKMPDDRHDDLVYINPAREDVPSINVLEPYVHGEMSQALISNQKEMIVSDVIDLFQCFELGNWGPLIADTITTLVSAYVEKNLHEDAGASLIDVHDALTNDDTLRDLTEDMYDLGNTTIAGDLEGIQSYTDKQLAPAKRRLSTFVRNDVVRRVIGSSPDTINFRRVIDEERIVLVDVPEGEVGSTVTKVVGSVVLSRIWTAAQSRVSMPEDERTPFYLFVDELSNFAGEYSNFSIILSSARKFKLGCWLVTQYLDHLHPDMQTAVLNNSRSKLVFRPEGTDDRHRLASLLNGVDESDLKRMGDHRAAVQTPTEGEYAPATIMRTYPPYTADRDSVDDIMDAAAGTSAVSQQPAMRQSGDVESDDGITGGDEHMELLEEAATFLEVKENAMVQIADQEPGVEKPDARAVMDGAVMNLEAEHSTLANPERVKANLAKARERDRTCLFAVKEGNEEKLERILENEDGDYRIISVTNAGGMWYDG